MKHLKYKGYLGTVEPDFENNILLESWHLFVIWVTYEAETFIDPNGNLKHRLIWITTVLCAEGRKNRL